MQNSLKNKVTLIGHVGSDPEVRQLEKNKLLSKFSIATNEYYYSKDGKKQQITYWHNIAMWGKTAEIASKYVKKGQEIAIEGKLTTRSYEDKEGNQKYITEVLAHEIILIGNKK